MGETGRVALHDTWRALGLLVGLVCLSGCGRIGYGTSLPPACPSDARLMGCYPFDGNVADATGHGNDGVAQNITFVPGIDGEAIHSTDASSRVDISMADFATTKLTFETWFRPDSVADNAILIDDDAHWALVLLPGGTIQCDGAVASAASTTLARVGRWTHVACTVDGTSTSIYVDGVLEHTTPDPNPILSGTGAICFANNGPPSQRPVPFLGSLDRIRIWKAVLSPSEICKAAGGC